jgi:MoaA/NifB/PqqE/SkfB family radical SAM enzyme
VTSNQLLTVISDRAKLLTNLLLRKPVLVTFQVTLRCNSACGYCDLPLNQGRYELSRQEIRSVFERLYADGIRFVLLQGGEPLLRSDLVDVLEDLTSLGLHVSVITNGTRLTKDLVERFASLRLPLSISLDTLAGLDIVKFEGLISCCRYCPDLTSSIAMRSRNFSPVL